MFGYSGIGQQDLQFDKFDYGFKIEVRPTDAEWQEIYLSAEKAHDKGKLSYSDTLFLREFNSIKQARLWLMMKEKRAEKMAAKMGQENAQMNAQVNDASQEKKLQGDLTLEDKKLQNALVLEEAKRKTLEAQALVLLGQQERIALVKGDIDRRENAQEGKIKDRHIDKQGEIDMTLKAMDINNRPEETSKQEKTLDEK